MGFYGALLREQSFGDLEITETVYAPLLRIPPHEHRSAYVSFVVRGAYIEQCGGARRNCTTSTVLFHPGGEYVIDDDPSVRQHNDSDLVLLHDKPSIRGYLGWRQRKAEIEPPFCGEAALECGGASHRFSSRVRKRRLAPPHSKARLTAREIGA